MTVDTSLQESSLLFKVSQTGSTAKSIRSAPTGKNVYTRCEFRERAIRAYEDEKGVAIRLNSHQEALLKRKGRTPLLTEQFSAVIDNLCPCHEEIFRFIQDESDQVQPLSISLFVINDMIRNIMRRKPQFKDTILPQVTIPWFHWSSQAENAANPYGVVREKNTGASVSVEDDSLIIEGDGGDFWGILEARIADSTRRLRAMILPGSVGRTDPVPAYKHAHIRIGMKTPCEKANLYPEPRKELDYRFSETPKVFFEDGMEIMNTGLMFSLKVTGSKEAPLRGDVILLIGRRYSFTDETTIRLRLHVWLTAVRRAVVGGPSIEP
ncbi:MAG: hypothetical protein ACTSVD_08790 [Candidatus Thorarchaeota archaeon]|nr:MAG: hypothetical protein DRO73_03640 [Candidatus Thorarchaeota archaeon]